MFDAVDEVASDCCQLCADIYGCAGYTWEANAGVTGMTLGRCVFKTDITYMVDATGYYTGIVKRKIEEYSAQ